MTTVKFMIKNYLKQFIECHKGTLNRVIHIAGFAIIGFGIFEKSIFLVLGGAIFQELGHVYQYIKTKNPKYSPLYCFKPQTLFAYPLFIIIILYVLFAK